MHDKKILIVEDNEDLLLLWRRLFRHLHVQCECAKSASEAFAKIDSGFVPDLLMTDQHLRDFTGTDLIKKLRADFPRMKVMLVSGTQPEELLPLLPEDASVFQKPVALGTLQEALETHLGRR